MSTNKFKMATLALVPIAVVGCASMESNQALEQARIAVQSAGNDPAVLSSAPVELSRARQSLETAQALYDDSGKKERTSVEHQAYLAKRYAEIAVTRAATESAQTDIENAQEERNRVLLQARSSEAQRSQQEAERSQQDARRAEREAQAALAEARELEQQLAELQAKQTERGLVLTLGDVLFDTNRAQLKAGADSTLDRLAQFMQEYPERTVLIEGHTDSTGAEDYNQMLSDQRANAVRDALLDRRIDSRRIQTFGVGEDAPVASNDTASGRQQNRRVEVIISDNEGQIAALASPRSTR